jgi:Protein of unknown function (DUF3551)
MRKIIGAAAFAAMAFTALPASAQDPYDYPWCLQGRIWGYPGSCNFTSYPQCQAAASGTDAYCGPNPQFYFDSQRRAASRPYRARRARRHSHVHQG